MGYAEFLKFADKLAELERKGFKLRGVEEPESIMEHSFRVALLALVLHKRLKLNLEKLVSLALIHDLAEAITGDITPFDGIDKEEKTKREDKAFVEICSNLPEEERRCLMNLYTEIKLKKTPEAKIIKQIDKLDMAYKALVYKSKGYEHMQEFIEEAERSISSDVLRDILEELKRSIR